MKKNYTKSGVIVLAVLAGIVVLSIAAFNIFNYFYWPKGHLKSTESSSNKTISVSNSPSDNLTPLNNKLYFNYSKPGDMAKHALVEINSNTSAIKHWGGFRLKGDSDGFYHKINTFKGSIIVNGYGEFDGKLYKYNTDTDKIELYSTLENRDKNKYIDYKIRGNKIYVISLDKIYVTYDGIKVKTVFDKMNDIAEDIYDISNDSLLYVSNNKHIKEYDLIKGKYVFDKKNTNKMVLESFIDYSIFKCGSQIILADSSGINENDYFKIYNVTDNFKMIYLDDYSPCCFGYCNNLLFMGYSWNYDETEGCLKVLDINTGKSKTISEDNTEDISVFGDKWVYYTDEDCRLFRITHNGKTKEKVFG